MIIYLRYDDPLLLPDEDDEDDDEDDDEVDELPEDDAPNELLLTGADSYLWVADLLKLEDEEDEDLE